MSTLLKFYITSGVYGDMPANIYLIIMVILGVFCITAVTGMHKCAACTFNGPNSF